MTEPPFFSVVTATYGRGKHIVPTIESVLRQSFDGFELIVVGDGCTDETEATVRSFESDKIVWRNLPQNTGSQSFPNNEGIRCSRGQWIAYLGHDDIWAPDHLESVAEAIRLSSRADVVIGGCVMYGPRGSGIYRITGLFEAPDAAFEHFFPPSSVSHRRDLTKRIGPWLSPHDLKPAVDAELLLRAAGSGMIFISTGRTTVHKFPAAYNYLSYLRANDDEQRKCLQDLHSEKGIDTAEIVAASKRNGDFMSTRHSGYKAYSPGQNFQLNRVHKGLSLPPLRPLPGAVTIKQTDDARGFDWYYLEFSGILFRRKPIRWSGPNPFPKILIPYTGGNARVEIEIVRWHDLRDLSLFAEGEPVPFRIEPRRKNARCMIADLRLKPDDYTVLTLHAPTFCPYELGTGNGRRRLGIAVGDIAIVPLAPLPAPESPRWVRQNLQT